MTTIEFFKYDADEVAQRIAHIESLYDFHKPFPGDDSPYELYAADMFPEDIALRLLPGAYEFFSVDAALDTAIETAFENRKAGYGPVEDFKFMPSLEGKSYARWLMEKSAKQIKSDKSRLAELVKQRYQADLDAKNAAEEERQIELLVAQAERQRLKEEEERVKKLREQARADLIAVYNAPEEGNE